MSRFTGPLTITHLDTDARLWRVESVLAFDVGSLGSGLTITAPAGFVTDGASVPRILWWLLPQWGSYSRSVTLHDVLCALLKAGTPHPAAKTWGEAARRLHEMTIVEGTGIALRTIMYIGVRLWAVWRDNAPFDVGPDFLPN